MNFPERAVLQMLALISRPLDGARCSLNQRKYRSSCPSQNTGSDTPTIANTIVHRAASDLGLTPEAMPSGMPIRSHRVAAPAARIAETGSRRKISSRTGW